jgi:hypothetical protein
MASAYPNIANFIRRWASTSSIKSYVNGVGIGAVGEKVYVNTGTVGLLADKAAHTALNVGAKNGSTVSVVETGIGGFLHNTAFTVTALPLTVPNAVAGTQGIGAKIYDFPEGRIYILGCTGSMAETTTSAILSTLNGGSTCKWGAGTTVGVNATLATTEQDILPVTSITSSATINVAGAVSKAALAAGAQFDGTGTALDMYLNFSVPTDGDLDADATITLTGTINLTWLYLGDY